MTNEERAREAAEKILIDLSDRSGMNLLDQIRWDDPELWNEILGEGAAAILTALNAATAELEEERGRLREAFAEIEKLRPLSDAATVGDWEYVSSTEHHGPYVVAPFGGDIADFYTMSDPGSLSVRNGGKSRPIHFLHEQADDNARLMASAVNTIRSALAKKDPSSG